MIELAEMVKQVIGEKNLKMSVSSSDDKRSYCISSEKIKKELGFVPKHTVEDAIRDLKKAFENNFVRDPLEAIRYYNIKTMQALNLK